MWRKVQSNMCHWEKLNNITSSTSAIATTAAAIAAYLTVKIAKKQIDEQLRPQLVIFFREESRLFRVGNVGKEAAMNIEIEVLRKPGLLAKADLGEASIAVPAGDEHTIFFRLNSTDGVMGQEANEPATHAVFRENKYKVRITYDDISGENTYITTYELGKSIKHISTIKTKVKNSTKNGYF